MASDRRLKGHPQVGAKYEAEGRTRPTDPFDSPRAVPLHYHLAHQDSRVLLDASGAPALHHEALDFITAGKRPARTPWRRFLSVGQVARLLELDLAALRHAILRGRFPAAQPGGPGTAYLVPVDALEQHLYGCGCPHDQIREYQRTWAAWLSTGEPPT
jgi:hypothetical protein